MSRFTPVFFALMTLVPTAGAAEPNPEDVKLAAFFRATLDEDFRRHPVYATQQGNHDHDDRLDDLSPAARAEDVKRAKELLAELPKKVDYARLSRDGQIDFEIWRHSLKSQVWAAENTDPFATDPRTYGEYMSDSVFLLFTQSTLPRERNVANAARRIAYVPKVVEAAKVSIKNPPKILTEIAIKRTAGAIAFYEKDIYEFAKETPATSELTSPCRAAVAALKEYSEYLEKVVLPKSEGDWRLGKDKFYQKLELELNAGLTGDEVIKAAEAEADRVEREMYYVAKQLWSKLFPGKALPPDDATGRHDTVKAVLDELGKDHGKPEEIVQDARKTVDKIKTFIKDKHILTLPNPDQCQIIEMPVFQRGFSAAYLNPAPPLDPKAASLYAVAPPPEDWPAARREAFLREYNRSMLQILTIHEAYPGHYVQLEYGNRNPSLIRKVLYSGVFAEGWAVYTEQMMLDQGYGDGDLALRLHQLKFYIRAVLNAILDHKMHCANMTDDEAMKLLVGRGFQTEGEAFGKVQRSKQSSCQLSTYFVGRTAFYRLRQEAQRQQGDKFDLGKYHEAVLNQGTLSVKYLPELLGVKK
ncbi:DUF885 domain-containing protein [Fimbriiglobus ruber]|uniref:DUF885 domain-containing protein n=1 Tax=Fimbriiglobus ruber TaxID=1908690 RepID=A0A225DQT5_9BACT|nr:DUF885 domain-containing protein [Fimbriiglobus ruber]OWK38537.1 protein of unknown function DUF885 [Fimbriiglobus ruber]